MSTISTYTTLLYSAILPLIFHCKPLRICPIGSELTIFGDCIPLNELNRNNATTNATATIIQPHRKLEIQSTCQPLLPAAGWMCNGETIDCGQSGYCRCTSTIDLTPVCIQGFSCGSTPCSSASDCTSNQACVKGCCNYYYCHSKCGTIDCTCDALSANPTEATTNPTTNNPTEMTTNPTGIPTKSPTKSPSKFPTASPSKYPSKSPSKFPTASPSKYPSKSPSKPPSKYPTKSPTKSSTLFPTAHPLIPTLSLYNQIRSLVLNGDYAALVRFLNEQNIQPNDWGLGTIKRHVRTIQLEPQLIDLVTVSIISVIEGSIVILYEMLSNDKPALIDIGVAIDASVGSTVTFMNLTFEILSSGNVITKNPSLTPINHFEESNKVSGSTSDESEEAAYLDQYNSHDIEYNNDNDNNTQSNIITTNPTESSDDIFNEFSGDEIISSGIADANDQESRQIYDEFPGDVSDQESEQLYDELSGAAMISNDIGDDNDNLNDIGNVKYILTLNNKTIIILVGIILILLSFLGHWLHSKTKQTSFKNNMNDASENV